MAKTIEVYTCTSCGHDNPEKSKKCNNCFTSFYEAGYFSNDWLYDKFMRRWVCPYCGRLNVMDNKTCSGCMNKTSKKEPSAFKDVAGIVIIGIGGIVACVALAGGNILAAGVGVLIVYGGYKTFKA